MPTVVSDTSPIRALAHLNLVPLLNQLASEILIPPAVARELASPRGRSPSLSIDPWPFIRIQSPLDRQAVQRLQSELQEGESEALILATEVKASLVIVDDAAARQVAKRLGFATVGVLGILLRSKTLGLIPEVKPLMDSLKRGLGFFIDDGLYAHVLTQAGEPIP